jgi:hypothetical protein
MTDAASPSPDRFFITPEFPRENDASLLDLGRLIRVVRVGSCEGRAASGATAGSPAGMEFWCEWDAIGPVLRTKLRLVPMRPMPAN